MVEEPLQGEMGRGAPSLIHRGRFAETVDGPELEELGARLEVPGTARERVSNGANSSSTVTMPSVRRGCDRNG